MKYAQSSLVRRSVTLTRAFACQWLTRQENFAHAGSFKRVIHAFWLPWLHWQRLAFILQELFGTFIHTHLEKAGVVGAGVDLQHILHTPDERGAGLGGNAPALLQPGFEFVFLRVLRTVSWLTCCEGIVVPLNLPEFRLLTQEWHEDGTVSLKVMARSETALCPHCQLNCTQIHDCRERVKRDVSLREYPVQLIVLKRRFRCGSRVAEHLPSRTLPAACAGASFPRLSSNGNGHKPRALHARGK